MWLTQSNSVLFLRLKLQQVAGRDKKVDIKPFLIQGLPSHIKPAEILVETISENQSPCSSA